MDIIGYLDTAAVGALSASLLLPVFIAILQHVEALKHDGHSAKSFDQLSAEYADWEKKAFFLFALCIAICTAVIWMGLRAFSTLHMAQLEDSVFLIAQPAVTWLLPAMFIGLFAGAIPLHYALRRLLGVERYAEYNEYVNQKHGVKSWKATLWMAYVVIPVCLIFTFLSLDAYARVTDRAFVVNRFLEIGETEYAFEDISSMSLIKSFMGRGDTVVRKPHYVIWFQDGTAYNFHKAMHGLSLAEQGEIINYIAELGQIRVTVVDPYPG